MSSKSSNTFNAFSEDTSLNKHGDKPTTNLIRKYEKKYRKAYSIYMKSRSDESYNNMEKYRKLINNEKSNESIGKKRTKKSKTIKQESTFDDILNEFNDKYRELDNISRNKLKERVESNQKHNMDKLINRTKIKAKRRLGKQLDEWFKYLRDDKGLIDLICDSELPPYVNIFLRNPHQYEYIKKFLSENEDESNEKYTTIIESVKIKFDMFLSERYPKRKIIRKSPKKLK
jgi:hypothetical protein